MYKLSPKEIDVMLNKPAKDRYIYFVKKVADWGLAWTLKDKDGLVTTSDDIGNIAFPVWPFKEYALRLKIDEWKECELVKLKLNILTNDILPNLAKDEINVTAFMVPISSEVITVSADRMLNDLLNESSKF
jgi:hypothetical protein